MLWGRRGSGRASSARWGCRLYSPWCRVRPGPPTACHGPRVMAWARGSPGWRDRPTGLSQGRAAPLSGRGVRFRDRDSCAAAPPLRDRRINGIAFSVSVLGARPRLPVPVMNALSLQWNHGSSFRHAAMGSRPRLSVMPSCAAVRSSIMPAVMRGPSLVVPYPGRLLSGRGREARRAVVGGGRLLPATLAGP